MGKILLLEDDQSLMDGLIYSLAKNGYEVTVARSVGEARATLQEQVYELLLLDVTLPDGTGFEICEEVRAGGSLVPILFLTAADEETNIIRGLDIGGDDYLTKPFRLGDKISLMLPDGKKKELTVSGFTGDTSMLTKQDAFGIFFSMDGFDSLFQKQKEEETVYYVQFAPYCNIAKGLAQIKSQLGLSEEQAGENVKLLAMIGMSRDSYMMQLYKVAAVLAVLVVLAGVFMIAGSLNSNVAKRTEFFGMMRCLGATKGQIARFVRCEALSWCARAIPAGVVAGIFITGVLCAVLRWISPTYFAEMPIFSVSVPAIVAGIVVGTITVLLAANAPAKHASKVSPLTAISGNARNKIQVKKAVNLHFFHVETVLGMHHATSVKKNLFLIVGSFSLSIELFLAFTTAIDFMNHAISPLQPYTPDLLIVSMDNTCSIPQEQLSQIGNMEGVKRVYGRKFAYGVPAKVNGRNIKINLISYEENQFAWAKKDLISGNLTDVLKGDGVITVYDSQNPLKMADTLMIEIDEKDVEQKICGVLSSCPFHREEGVETIICSEELFTKLTGQSDYTILDIQLNRTATDEMVTKIRTQAGNGITFSDQRESNEEVRGVFFAMALFMYSFLTIIALITVFHIINSIAMSVSARLQQYGAMRAIGMSDAQVLKMVAAETVTYIMGGVIVGCLIGLPANRFLYTSLVTARWGDPWYLPGKSMVLIVTVVIFSALLAVLGPAKRIREMSIVETMEIE